MTHTPSPDEIYRAVRALLDDLPPNMRARAAALLRQAEDGRKTDNALLRLLRQDAAIYRRFQQLLHPGETLGARGFTPIAGEPDDIPAGQEWKCPHPGCRKRGLSSRKAKTRPIALSITCP